ncbi:MAG: CBM48, partial [uncultured Friedmanniella sp.]
DGDLAWLVRAAAAGRPSGRGRDHLRGVLGRGDRGDALPVRRERVRGAAADAGPRRRHLARLRARRRTGPAVRLPRARPVRPGRRPPLQPGQAAARPVRAGHRRRRPLGAVPARRQPGGLRRGGAAVG